MTTRVLCIRHGETVWNASGRWQGSAPIPLSETGRAQSQALGAYLAAHGPRPEVIVSSDSPRARQTAEAIAAPLALPLHFDARLREINVGVWQGMTREEVLAWDGERYAVFIADWYNNAPPNGETRNELMARARAAFDAITTQHPGRTIAIVTHGGTLGMLLESLFGRIERPTLSNTSITIVRHGTPDNGASDSGNWQLERIAWTPHLTQNPLGETW